MINTQHMTNPSAIDIHPRIQGSDLEAELTISSADAQAGTTLNLRLHRGGDPVTVRVKVPVGTQSGERLRLRSQGADFGGGPRGDFYIILQVSAPDKTQADVVSTPPPAQSQSATHEPKPPPLPTAPSSEAPSASGSAEPEGFGPLTSTLWLGFLLCAGIAFWGARTDWFKALDRPTPETFLVSAGESWVMNLETGQKSVKGYYRIKGAKARLSLEGIPGEIPVEFKDLNGRDWSGQISYKTNALTSEFSTPNETLTVRFATDIPNDAALIGKTGKLTVDMPVVFPWFVKDSAGKKSFEDKEWSLNHTWAVKVMPPGYIPLHSRIRWLATLLVVAFVPFGIVRANCRGRTQIIAAVILLTAAGGIYWKLLSDRQPKSAPLAAAGAEAETPATSADADGAPSIIVAGKQFSKLAEAIAGAPDGAVITLKDGSRHEGLFEINRSITLEGKAKIVRPASDKSGKPVLVISAPGARVQLRDITIVSHTPFESDTEFPKLVASAESASEPVIHARAGDLELHRCAIVGSRSMGLLANPAEEQNGQWIIARPLSVTLRDTVVRNIRGPGVAMTGIVSTTKTSQPKPTLRVQGGRITSCATGISLVGVMDAQIADTAVDQTAYGQLGLRARLGAEVQLSGGAFTAGANSIPVAAEDKGTSVSIKTTELGRGSRGVSVQRDELAKLTMDKTATLHGRTELLVLVPSTRYPTLAEALVKAPAQSALVLDPDSQYQGPLLISRPLTILGRGATIGPGRAYRRLTAVFPSGGGTYAGGVDGKSQPILVVDVPDGEGVTLESVIVNGKPTGTEWLADDKGGHGIEVRRGHLTLNSSLVSNANDAGVYIGFDRSRLKKPAEAPRVVITNSAIRDSRRVGVGSAYFVADPQMARPEDLNRPPALTILSTEISQSPLGIIAGGWSDNVIREVTFVEIKGRAIVAGDGALLRVANMKKWDVESGRFATAEGFGTRVHLFDDSISASDFERGDSKAVVARIKQ